MEINRRGVLTGALAVTAGLFTDAQAETMATNALYAATRKSNAGDYSAAIFDATGHDLNAVPLPARGHDITVCPVHRRCVAFARRPGNFAVAFSTDKSAAPIRFTTPPDRHFYGHGIFSPDGRLLFTTENDFDAGEGRIGIYDATDGFKRLGEFSAYGVGPHDIALLSDGITLVIANGGIATHPDFGEGRLQMNLATMAPCLSYIDLRNGDLIETHALPQEFHQASLRHLDKGVQDRIVIGCQSKAEYGGEQPLVLRHRCGEELSIVALEPEIAPATRGYISSVAVDKSGEIAALTSSKGSLVLFVDVTTGRLMGRRNLSDVSGVASGSVAGSFLLTSGYGDVVENATLKAASHLAETRWHWDNHAVAL